MTLSLWNCFSEGNLLVTESHRLFHAVWLQCPMNNVFTAVQKWLSFSVTWTLKLADINYCGGKVFKKLWVKRTFLQPFDRLQYILLVYCFQCLLVVNIYLINGVKKKKLCLVGLWSVCVCVMEGVIKYST